MLFTLAVLLASPVIELPHYKHEILRVEKHYNNERSVKSFVIRINNYNSQLSDYIDTTRSSSNTTTFDHNKCPVILNLVNPKNNIDSMKKTNETINGNQIISVDGPYYRVIKNAPYVTSVESNNTAATSLSPLGIWAESVIKAADACRAP